MAREVSLENTRNIGIMAEAPDRQPGLTCS